MLNKNDITRKNKPYSNNYKHLYNNNLNWFVCFYGDKMKTEGKKMLPIYRDPVVVKLSREGKLKEKIEKLRESIKDLEDNLLAYRRPRGSSVVNVREDERKKTIAEVSKCSVCKESKPIELMSIECPDCYLKGMEKEGFISKEEVAKEINKLPTHIINDFRKKELKQKLGIK